MRSPNELASGSHEPGADMFYDFLGRLEDGYGGGRPIDGIKEMAEVITAESPLMYVSMEFYDKEEHDIKGGGGLGILAADIRRQAEQLGIPLVILTPYYTKDSHARIVTVREDDKEKMVQEAFHEKNDPALLYKQLGSTAISTETDKNVSLDVYGRASGSTRIITITEPNFGELYPGGNSDSHRLYQEVALGFAGYKAIKEEGLNPRLMQLNESPTVFAAVAKLDDLCNEGKPFEDALTDVRQQMIYTNHTLVPAAEGEFERGQFESIVMPNIQSDEVKGWIRGLFTAEDKLRLSSLAIELAETKTAVSKLHAAVSDFKDRSGERVKFDAVTNGISRKWTLPETMKYFRELDVLDRFDLPTEDFSEKLESIDKDKILELKQRGRQVMNDILSHRKDQYGEPVHIPEDAVVYDFKRRFVKYKRPDMIFGEPDRLAEILESQNAHFILTGKPHPNDKPMQEELTRLLGLIDENPVLRERVHYVQDYDEELGRALSVGADCAINVPEVGKEACGTSWMKDMSNFKLLISTPDGGVADVQPIACLRVEGNEQDELYKRMSEAAHIVRTPDTLKEVVVNQLKEYMPIISGSRMMAEYLKLFHQLYLHSHVELAPIS
jgi:starch phosphorylase